MNIYFHYYNKKNSYENCLGIAPLEQYIAERATGYKCPAVTSVALILNGNRASA
jgi:hypothetical protein